MKKLVIVALALVLAMTFVGCGPANMLMGTQWYEEYTFGGISYKETYSFEAENVFKWTSEVIAGSSVNTPTTYTGTWSTEGADILITEVENAGGVTGKWTVAFDEENKDILILTRETDNKVLKLNRVKDAE